MKNAKKEYMCKIVIRSVGVTNQGAHTNVYVGPKVQSKEELLLGQARPKTKGMAYH